VPPMPEQAPRAARSSAIKSSAIKSTATGHVPIDFLPLFP
jgi:hypothetical protein